MSLEWIHEKTPTWDESKASIVGGAPKGIFALQNYGEGDLIPGEWWRVQDGGAVVGYGWMDCTWGDAEILLAVDPGKQKSGVGSYILDQLEKEASTRGLNYMYNVVRETHPEHDRISAWLEARKFTRGKADRLMRRVMHPSA